jgi:tetratricopeptide (TPR) repeat protein
MGRRDKKSISFTNSTADTSQDIELLVISAGLLESSVRKNDPWDLKHGTAFCKIGNVCSRMGMPSEALAMYEKDLQITGQCLSNDDLRVVGSKYNCGLALCKLGRYAEALTLLEDVLRVRTAALGSHHVDLADALTCIGGIHSCTGRHAEALDRYQQATSIHKADLGPNHPTVALSLRNSATALACLGQTSRAIEDCEEARAILLHQVCPDHRLTAEVKQLLADLAAGNPRAQVAFGSTSKYARHALLPPFRDFAR